MSNLVSVRSRPRAVTFQKIEAQIYENMIVEKGQEFLATKQSDDLGPVSDAAIVEALHMLETNEPESEGAYASLIKTQTYRSCEADIAIDVVAILLGFVNVPSKSARKAAGVIWDRLPSRVQRDIINKLKRGNLGPQDILEIFQAVFTNTNSSTLSAAFNDLSWWDYAAVTASIAATVAGGGIPLLVDIGFTIYDFVQLGIKIGNCASAF
jgi:hypothetical protein